MKWRRFVKNAIFQSNKILMKQSNLSASICWFIQYKKKEEEEEDFYVA